RSLRNGSGRRRVPGAAGGITHQSVRTGLFGLVFVLLRPFLALAQRLMQVLLELIKLVLGGLLDALHLGLEVLVLLGQGIDLLVRLGLFLAGLSLGFVAQAGDLVLESLGLFGGPLLEVFLVLLVLFLEMFLVLLVLFLVDGDADVRLAVGRLGLLK